MSTPTQTRFIRRAKLIAAIAAGAAALEGGDAHAARDAADQNPAKIGGKPNMNGIWQAVGSALLEPRGPFGAGSEQLLAARRDRRDPGGPERRRRRHDSLQARGARAARRESHGLAEDGSRGEVLHARHAARDLHAATRSKSCKATATSCSSYEFASANRVVHMAKHEESPVDSWMGWSNGHWEGDTLVIDVTGSTTASWFDRAGNYHDHVAARSSSATRCKDKDHLQYEATIEDPETYTRAVEDPHAALQTRRAERAAARVQVRGVLRRAAVRGSDEENEVKLAQRKHGDHPDA